MQQHYEMSELGLPGDIVETLKNGGVSTVEQLRKTHPHELLKLRGMDKTKLQTLEKSLLSLGIIPPLVVRLELENDLFVEALNKAAEAGLTLDKWVSKVVGKAVKA